MTIIPHNGSASFSIGPRRKGRISVPKTEELVQVVAEVNAAKGERYAGP